MPNVQSCKSCSKVGQNLDKTCQYLANTLPITKPTLGQVSAKYWHVFGQNLTKY